MSMASNIYLITLDPNILSIETVMSLGQRENNNSDVQTRYPNSGLDYIDPRREKGAGEPPLF